MYALRRPVRATRRRVARRRNELLRLSQSQAASQFPFLVEVSSPRWPLVEEKERFVVAGVSILRIF
jgi:CRISPR/Cas system Type II protein with McrA/HNH and RuvC-like nuclease domain